MTRHENIGGVIFPVTYMDNGMVLVDYPYSPIVAKEITEEGRKNITKLSEALKELRDKQNNTDSI